MARYQNEEQAAADGFRIVHEPDRSRYAIYGPAAAAVLGGIPSSTDGGGERLVGEAHYSHIGEDTIDFDHTVVLPEFRGTGLSGLLAGRALTGNAVAGRRVIASCWFIEGYLTKHPELRTG